jgi:UDP-2,4-diacetamido-2,4,6-trideoxy-beta-L-altropyranose hydrolase
MNPGTLLIRADASAAIGTGHVMRCLALAQAWRHAGGDVVLGMAQCTLAVEQRLLEEGCRIERFSAMPGSGDDVKATRLLIASESPEWFVLDGYKFDSVYREAIRDAGPKFLVVDDSGGQDCFSSDLVLNQNAHAAAKLYPRRADHTRLLLGPRYAMLRREFATYSDYVREIPKNGKKLLVTMGGSDPQNFTRRVLPHLRERLAHDVQIRVVLGGDAGHASAIAAQAAGFHERIRVQRDVRNMAELMVWADLAVAAAGTTCWEMCSLGLPAIIVEASDNQRLIARKVSENGAAVNAGSAQSVDCTVLAELASDLLKDQEQRRHMSHQGRYLVDGRGTLRVLSLMNQQFRIRPAEARDCRTLWVWANDPVVRAASFSEEPIAWETHERWFERQLQSAVAQIYITENQTGESVGQVRYQIEAQSARLSICLGPKFRGRGLGSIVLLLGIEELFNTSLVDTINAYVKPTNKRSLELFRCSGFENKGEAEVGGHRAVWFVLQRWRADE